VSKPQSPIRISKRPVMRTMLEIINRPSTAFRDGIFPG
jgi:hypothetical protein